MTEEPTLEDAFAMLYMLLQQAPPAHASSGQGEERDQDSFIDGAIAAVRLYSVYKDGEMVTTANRKTSYLVKTMERIRELEG